MPHSNNWEQNFGGTRWTWQPVMSILAHHWPISRSKNNNFRAEENLKPPFILKRRIWVFKWFMQGQIAWDRATTRTHCRSLSSGSLIPYHTTFLVVHASVRCVTSIRADFKWRRKVLRCYWKGDVGSIPGQGAEIPNAFQPKNQNIKQKQWYNKFNKDFLKNCIGWIRWSIRFHPNSTILQF